MVSYESCLLMFHNIEICCGWFLDSKVMNAVCELVSSEFQDSLALVCISVIRGIVRMITRVFQKCHDSVKQPNPILKTEFRQFLPF